MSDNVLILHPRDALYVPGDVTALTRWLERQGLVRDGHASEGDDPPGSRLRFRTGARFEELIVFGGEASRERRRAILADASVGPRAIDRVEFVRDICCVVVVGPLEREYFLAGASTDDPVCGACGERADWGAIANEWCESWTAPEREGAPEVACSACGSRAAPWAFDWRGTAAFARFYVEIWHVHEGEAAPSQAFVEALAAKTGTPWSVLYYHL